MEKKFKLEIDLSNFYKNNAPHHSFVKEEFQKFNKKSGIYALMYHDEIIYVGQSVDIGRRLREHANETAIQKTINQIYREDGKANRSKQLAKYIFIDRYREEIEFIILKETDELDKWEEYFISLYQPKYNYVGVDVPFRAQPCEEKQETLSPLTWRT